eukprot:6618565-Prymnesium_polylepis.1
MLRAQVVRDERRQVVAHDDDIVADGCGAAQRHPLAAAGDGYRIFGEVCDGLGGAQVNRVPRLTGGDGGGDGGCGDAGGDGWGAVHDDAHVDEGKEPLYE